MKVFHISTSDISGGAAIAAYRTHLGLERLGVDSKMFVSQRRSDSDRILGPSGKYQKAVALIRPLLDSLPLKLFSRKDSEGLFSLQWAPGLFQLSLENLSADVLNFHWMCSGFQRIESLARESRPQVWTLHDMWAFTGGCHYSGECTEYLRECGSCNYMRAPFKGGPAHWVWKRKKAAFAKANITIVCPSRWLAKCAKESSLLREKEIHVIPYGIDLDRFRPHSRETAREILGLNKGKKLILFGATRATSDRRKGFQYLLPAIQKLKDSTISKEVELVVFGASRPTDTEDLGIPATYLGHLSDEVSLSLTYAACDVFLAPSVQDNLPNTVIEALACGTPCIAFDIGGMPDMIDSGKNGYLARPFDVEDFARGIEFVLTDRERHRELCKEARQKAEREYDLLGSAQKYRDLYERLGRIQ